MIHTAVQENDLEMRIYTWESILSFYFYFNKTNDARYGTYYVRQLSHLKTLHPELKPLLEVKRVRMLAHSFYQVQTSTDLTSAEDKQLIEMLKLQVRCLMLGNV